MGEFCLRNREVPWEGSHRSKLMSRRTVVSSNEPETKRPDGLTTREGLNLAGRHDHRWSCPGAMKPTGRALGSDQCGRERVLLRPQGLSGTAVRGPACAAVWEPGWKTLAATRMGLGSDCTEQNLPATVTADAF
jgi:hypothetical protein